MKQAEVQPKKAEASGRRKKTAGDLPEKKAEKPVRTSRL